MIEVENLTKRFQRPVRQEGFKGLVRDLFDRRFETKTAVDDISFRIGEGEIVGYLGPNGAGKSTSIKMMVGILTPSEGSVRVNGIVPYRNRKANAKHIGVVFGQRSQLWWDIPVSESLSLYKTMYKVTEERYKRNLELFGDVLGLGEYMNVAVRQLSLGQRMRAELAAALMHDPAILYLDEPTIGLDVVVKKKIREFLLEINRDRKTTILLTTHDMSDVEKLCSRVIVIGNGKKAYDGPLDSLKTKYGTGEWMKVRLERLPDGCRESLLALGASTVDYEADEGGLSITFDRSRLNPTAILQWLMSRATMIDFEIKPPDIEDVIRGLYGEAEADENVS